LDCLSALKLFVGKQEVHWSEKTSPTFCRASFVGDLTQRCVAPKRSPVK